MSATIRNIGDTAGEEIVQLYLSGLYVQLARPVRQVAPATVTPVG